MHRLNNQNCSYMETKTKKSKSEYMLELSQLGYNVTSLRNLKHGDIFQTREDGVYYVRAHYVHSSKKYCYFRYDDINRYYYANGDKLVILV